MFLRDLCPWSRSFPFFLDDLRSLVPCFSPLRDSAGFLPNPADSQFACPMELAKGPEHPAFAGSDMELDTEFPAGHLLGAAPPDVSLSATSLHGSWRSRVVGWWPPLFKIGNSPLCKPSSSSYEQDSSRVPWTGTRVLSCLRI